MHKRIELKAIFCLVIGVILLVCIYQPGLNGSFVFDDVGNIYENQLLKIEHFTFEDLWQASLSSNSGPLRRPVAMFSFAINHVLTGMDPWWMKLTNLGIHLINGLILLLVLKQLFGKLSQNNYKYAAMLPSFIALIWLIHPINVTAVSYIVQRMASLSATFVLLAIYCYMKLREGKYSAWRSYTLSFSILIFWLLGLLTKETAISLSIYIFVIEWCVYGFQADSKGEKWHLGILWALLAAPWVCAFIYILYEPSIILAGYAIRDFTMVERVLTEFRVVIDYLRLIIIPDIRHMGLLHDDIVLSRSLITPISTLLSMLLIIGLLILAVRVKQRFPLFCLGIFWFFGGHVLESSIYPLELMFLHRNYLPSVGIILALSEVFCLLYRNYRILTIVTTCAVVLGFSVCTRSLAYRWSDDYRMSIVEAMNHPKSIRANYVAGQVLVAYAVSTSPGKQRDEYKRMAIEYFRKIRTLDPGDVSGEMGILDIYLRLKETPPESLVESLIQGLPATNVKLRIINIFASIEICLIEEKCSSLRADEFQKMMEALYSNPDVSGQYKAQLLANYAAYVLYYESNLDKAINIVLQAINTEPSELKLYTLLIEYYAKNGNVKDMKQAIVTLESKDILGRYRKYIRQVREEVDDPVDLPYTP